MRYRIELISSHKSHASAHSKLGILLGEVAANVSYEVRVSQELPYRPFQIFKVTVLSGS